MAQPGQFNQFNTINWYQQTWHTIEFSNNRHTRHHHNPNGRGSLRSNFSNLPESGTLCKSAFPRPTNHPTRPHQNPERTKRRPDPVLKFRGLAASGSQLLAGLPLGDLENNTPTTPPPQTHPHTTPKPRKTAAKTTHHTPHPAPRHPKPELCRASPPHPPPHTTTEKHPAAAGRPPAAVRGRSSGPPSWRSSTPSSARAAGCRQRRDGVFDLAAAGIAVITLIRESTNPREEDLGPAVSSRRPPARRAGCVQESTAARLSASTSWPFGWLTRSPPGPTVLTPSGLELTNRSSPPNRTPGARTRETEVLSASTVVVGHGKADAVRAGAESFAIPLTASARGFLLVNSELRHGLNGVLRWITVSRSPWRSVRPAPRRTRGAGDRLAFEAVYTLVPEPGWEQDPAWFGGEHEPWAKDAAGPAFSRSTAASSWPPRGRFLRPGVE